MFGVNTPTFSVDGFSDRFISLNDLLTTMRQANRVCFTDRNPNPRYPVFMILYSFPTILTLSGSVWYEHGQQYLKIEFYDHVHARSGQTKIIQGSRLILAYPSVMEHLSNAQMNLYAAIKYKPSGSLPEQHQF